MYGYILLSLVLAFVAVDLAHGPPPAVLTAVGGAAGATAVVLAAGLAINLYIRRWSAAASLDEKRFLRGVGVLGKLYRLLVVAAYATILFVWRWASLARHWAGQDAWLVAQLAMAVAPLVVLQATAWITLYSADRRLRAFLFQRAGAAVAVQQWTLPRYLEFMFRQYLLIALVPLLVLAAADDAIIRGLGPPDVQPLSAAALLALLVVAVSLSGLWFRLCWRTEAFPESPLRDRLRALADRAGVRVGNILVWRTNVTIANGCMVGMVGPLRYIFITDALLLSLPPEEIEAVFAHEVAHVKFSHVLLYMVMAMGGGAAGLLAGTLATALDTSYWTQNLAVGAAVLAYWGLGFGFVSRRCELECDLYAARATTCPAGCSPPDGGARSRAAEAAPVAGGGPPAAPGVAEAAPAFPSLGAAAAGPVGAGLWAEGPGEAGGGTPAPPDGQALPAGICEHRVMAMVTALRRIARLNGTPEQARGWRHFSIARRCRFLMDVLSDASLVGRLERRLRWIKVGVVAAAFALVLAAGLVVSSIEGPSESDHPENPAGPEDLAPRVHRWLVRLVDRNEVDVVAFGSPQFRGDADAVADLDDGRHARLGRGAAVRDDQVAVHEPRGHAVAVDAQGKRSGRRPGDARELEKLDDPVRGGRR